MRQARFNLESRKDEHKNVITKNVPVRLSYFIHGKRLEYYTGVSVTNAKNFDKDYYKNNKNPIKANEPSAARKNSTLNSIKKKAEAIYDNAMALEIPPTPAYIREKLDQHFKGKAAAQTEILLKNAVKEFIQHGEASKAERTFKKWRTMFTHLQNAFEKSYSKIGINEVNTAFVQTFRNYFITTGYTVKGKKKDFSYNTVVKYLSCFREFINWCKDEDRMYHTVKIKYGNLTEEEPNVIYLNNRQIKKLEGEKMPNRSLEQVKDVFLFGCYTGLRYSDIFKLKKKDVSNNKIRFYITKNNEITWHTVPLIKQAKNILGKYKELDGDKALPVISNQKMNDYLKTVMELSGFNQIMTIRKRKADGSIEELDMKLWELISCHNSRKSFISLAVSRGVAELKIKAITGHSKNSRAFGRYFSVSDETKAEAMKEIFKNPSSKLRKVS